MTQVTLVMPDWAYNTIMETLQMDAESSSFAPEIRLEIRKALDAIHNGFRIDDYWGDSSPQ